ncbi:MAG: RsmE family RNA methyltransferase, partial [Senegalia sp. (in: firmicutes)]
PQIMNLESAVKEMQKNNSFIIVPYENENKIYIKEVLKKTKEKDISIIIGPEGGFSESEIKKLQEIGASIVSLGPRILRTETAGLTLISIIMYQLGDVGGI